VAHLEGKEWKIFLAKGKTQDYDIQKSIRRHAYLAENLYLED